MNTLKSRGFAYAKPQFGWKTCFSSTRNAHFHEHMLFYHGEMHVSQNGRVQGPPGWVNHARGDTSATPNRFRNLKIMKIEPNRAEIEDLGLKLAPNESSGCSESNGSSPDSLKPSIILQNTREIVQPARSQQKYEENKSKMFWPGVEMIPTSRGIIFQYTSIPKVPYSAKIQPMSKIHLIRKVRVRAPIWAL